MMTISLTLLFLGCSNQGPNSLSGVPVGLVKDFRALPIISCVHAANNVGAVITNVHILIGSKVDTPFKGNYFQADSDGCFNLPSGWVDKQPVTIDAPGYVRATFLDVEPAVRSYTLHPADGQERNELKGTATGFGTLKKDGFIDFALVIPMLSRFQLNQFNISDLISPETDKISVVGQSVVMPSNISLPKQSENYSILSITLNKPVFRSYFRTLDMFRIMSARGKFPFKEVVKELNAGKSLFDVVNKLEFLSAGRLDIAITSPSTQKDIATADVTFAQSLSVTAPTYAKGLTMVSVLLNRDGNLYLPSDVKTVESQKTMTLKGVPGNAQSVLNILGKSKVLSSGMVTLEEQMSSAILPSLAASNPNFLSPIPAPVFNGTVVKSIPPETATGIQASGVYAVISDVDITNTADAYFEEKTRLWEIYGDQWVAEWALPEWPSAIATKHINRLEVSYLGRINASGVSHSGPEMVELSTHATKNSLDF